MTDATKPQLRFWNTLTRAKQDFVPIDRDNVRMYVCGPTVYDFAHIGNARPAIVFDVLFRLLRHVYGESHVTYVRNITDVDDKINARALRDHPDLPLNEAIALVTEKTAAQYFKDVKALGCLEPTVQPRATEHIAGMVKMIQTLIDRGNAYLTEGREGREVLFAVESMPSYGALSNRRLEDQQAGARVAVEEHKRNPGDFVLWKESAADQPGWLGEFTDNGATVSVHGRPGWHIECSVMSEAHLGETFDIHGGGLDLIFPHHENEIAQSVCAHGGATMANVWMHNGFLQVEGRKMSKSDGNFVTIAELLETDKFGGRKWPGEVLRLAMLMTHYREPIDFSVKRLEEAERLVGRWPTDTASGGTADATVVAALADDMNTPAAVQSLHALGQAAAGDPALLAAFTASASLLGITPQATVIEAGFADRVQQLVDDRLALIKARNWADADTLRDEIVGMGIQLMDGKDPVTGERVTTWEVKR
ncbi:cysteinyl-tRNA synthetase [Hoeflea marina]|uniref:Cysteine--tRNA ligase n=1 Tax=Hoeflea marina TaxID=274592 RepID=A0A317PH22_9HYPH|nr:cysteine--tRNA ligase [Hoeflea marina]PWV98748.1 cysteinyl-tRNA synthetase [Hoeflea marina]